MIITRHGHWAHLPNAYALDLTTTHYTWYKENWRVYAHPDRMDAWANVHANFPKDRYWLWENMHINNKEFNPTPLFFSGTDIYRDCVLALIACDNGGDILKMPIDEVKTLVGLDVDAAILLWPVCKILQKPY